MHTRRLAGPERRDLQRGWPGPEHGVYLAEWPAVQCSPANRRFPRNVIRRVEFLQNTSLGGVRLGESRGPWARSGRDSWASGFATASRGRLVHVISTGATTRGLSGSNWTAAASADRPAVPLPQADAGAEPPGGRRTTPRSRRTVMAVIESCVRMACSELWAARVPIHRQNHGSCEPPTRGERRSSAGTRSTSMADGQRLAWSTNLRRLESR